MQSVFDLGQQLFVGERFADVAGNPGLDRLRALNITTSVSGYFSANDSTSPAIPYTPASPLQIIAVAFSCSALPKAPYDKRSTSLSYR